MRLGLRRPLSFKRWFLHHNGRDNKLRNALLCMHSPYTHAPTHSHTYYTTRSHCRFAQTPKLFFPTCIATEATAQPNLPSKSRRMSLVFGGLPNFWVLHTAEVCPEWTEKRLLLLPAGGGDIRAFVNEEQGPMTPPFNACDNCTFIAFRACSSDFRARPQSVHRCRTPFQYRPAAEYAFTQCT